MPTSVRAIKVSKSTAKRLRSQQAVVQHVKRIPHKRTPTKAQQIAKKLDLRLLQKGRVVVIGCGGIGSWLIRPLAVFLGSMGTKKQPMKMSFVDGDFFEESNNYRVYVPAGGVFYSKSQSHCQKVHDKFYPAVEAGFHPEYITEDNGKDLLKDGDVVFLCVDNHATRKLVNRLCLDINNVVLISGGNDGVDKDHEGTCGNIQVMFRQKGKLVGGCDLEKYHNEITNPRDKNPADFNCMEMVQQGDPQICFANLAVASAMCNALWRLLSLKKADKPHSETVLDIYAGVVRPVPGV